MKKITQKVKSFVSFSQKKIIITGRKMKSFSVTCRVGFKMRKYYEHEENECMFI